MIHIIYPIDLDCELTDKVEFKKFTIPNTPNNLPCKLDIKVYKFGIGIVDFIFDKLDINDPYTVKLSKRLTLSKYSKTIEKHIFKDIEQFKLKTYGQRYEGEFFYPITIDREKISVLKDKAQIPEEKLNVLKLLLAQYWNLISYDAFLNKEVDSSINMLYKIKISFNFIKLIKNYFMLFNEGKKFHRDRLNIVNSLYRTMENSFYDNDPEYMDFYKKCKDVMVLGELEKSVINKIDKISETYSFLGNNISTLFFIFFNIVFMLWAFWGIVDTFLLWKLGK